MAVIQEYKCPCCGGAIAFDSTIQKMKCPYCDTEFEMETLADYDKELKSEQPDDMFPVRNGRMEKWMGCVPMFANPAAAKLWGTKIQRLPPARSAATLSL